MSVSYYIWTIVFSLSTNIINLDWSLRGNTNLVSVNNVPVCEKSKVQVQGLKLTGEVPETFLILTMQASSEIS